MWENAGVSYIEDALFVLSRAGQRITADFDAAPGDMDLASNRVVVALIMLRRDGPQRPTRIAGECGLTSGGATKLLTRLERRGLVVRRSGMVPDDGRAVVISITPAGRSLLKEILEVVSPRIDELIRSIVKIGEGA